MADLRVTRRRAVRLGNDEGAAILEFAVALPLLVVFVVGISDFSDGFNQKQKIAQAAQEGAIIAGAQPMTDIQASNPNPDSLQPVWTAVHNSLVASGVLPNAACPTPGPPVPGANLAWTYSFSSCPGDLRVAVTRGLSVPVLGSAPPQSAICTTVTVTYTTSWRFHSVIRFITGPTETISESATVHNQT